MVTTFCISTNAKHLVNSRINKFQTRAGCDEATCCRCHTKPANCDNYLITYAQQQTCLKTQALGLGCNSIHYICCNVNGYNAICAKHETERAEAQKHENEEAEAAHKRSLLSPEQAHENFEKNLAKAKSDCHNKHDKEACKREAVFESQAPENGGFTSEL